MIFQYREYALAGGLMSYGSSEGAGIEFPTGLLVRAYEVIE